MSWKTIRRDDEEPGARLFRGRCAICSESVAASIGCSDIRRVCGVEGTDPVRVIDTEADAETIEEPLGLLDLCVVQACRLSRVDLSVDRV